MRKSGARSRNGMKQSRAATARTGASAWARLRRHRARRGPLAEILLIPAGVRARFPRNPRLPTTARGYLSENECRAGPHPCVAGKAVVVRLLRVRERRGEFVDLLDFAL